MNWPFAFAFASIMAAIAALGFADAINPQAPLPCETTAPPSPHAIDPEALP